MDKEELQAELDALFNPEPEEDGLYLSEYPHERIAKSHKLDVSYMNRRDYEGSTIHPYTRICSPDEHRLISLGRNHDVSQRLFMSALQLFGDSIIAYHDKKERNGHLRYYPPIIMTFWSGFETYVRYSSAGMLITVKDIPKIVEDYLLEKETYLDEKGKQCIKNKWQPILYRYALLLKYGYNYEADKGNKHWQAIQKAKELRDYYNHLDIQEPRAISSKQVLDFMEAVMMALIWPSCELKRTLFLGIYYLYDIWAELYELQKEYIEQPMFKDWHHNKAFMFHCNFENVDTSRFPNSKEDLKRRSNGV